MIFDKPFGWTVVLGQHGGVNVDFTVNGNERFGLLLSRDDARKVIGFLSNGIRLLDRVEGERKSFVTDLKRSDLEAEAVSHG